MASGVPDDASKAGENDPLPPPRPALPECMHCFSLLGIKFEVNKRFHSPKPVGQGSYGVVGSCFDQECGIRVAIKKIPHAFVDVQDVKRLLREVRMLKVFDHENIIGLRNLLRPPSCREFDELYIVTELMDTDLYQIISSKQQLTDDHHQYFLYQILRGLKFLHSANVMHRDMKPSNLLINENCDLKICDFGLARLTYPEEQDLLDDMTQYVVTRWYRPPELLLSSREYTNAVDMWSVGCILAEMIGRRPLFPGKDYFHQLCLVTDVVGTNKECQYEMIVDEASRSFLQRIPSKSRVPLSKVYPRASAQCIDLLERLLVFSPKRRVSVCEAIRHPYLSSLHDPNDEPTVSMEFDAEFEVVDSLPELHDMVLKEILTFDSNALRQRSCAPLNREMGAGTAEYEAPPADDLPLDSLESDSFDTSY